MIHSKQTYVKNNKKLLRKVHSKWTVVSVALLSMIGLGGLSIHQANADSVHANQDPNIVTSWTPKVANIQSQKAVTNASQNSSNISSAKTANFGATDEQSQTQLNTNDGSENSSNSQNQAQKTVAAQIPKTNLLGGTPNQQRKRVYPFNVQVNTYDKKTNAAIDSHLYHMIEPNNKILNFNRLIEGESRDKHFTIPNGTNTSIQLTYGNGDTTTDPSTGFTKQPANTQDIAFPGAGWHAYVNIPYVAKDGTSLTLTGDFSNYHPLYKIGKLVSTLQEMGINPKNIFPNSKDTEIPGFLGNRLPTNLLQQVNKECQPVINHLTSEFQGFSNAQKQHYDEMFSDPNDYWPDTSNNPKYNKRQEVISGQRTVTNQQYINSMFPDIANELNQFPDIAVRIRIGRFYTTKYLQTFNNLVNSIKSNISHVYLGNAKNLTSTQAMFYGMNHLKSIDSIGNFDTGQVNDMAEMFANCPQLMDISGLKGFNTSNVMDMQNMFKSDHMLSNITPLMFWNTHNVYNMDSMFANSIGAPGHIKNLKPLAHWDTSNVLSLSMMFSGQTGLTDISPLSNWKLSDYVYGLNGTFSNDLNIANHPNWTPNDKDPVFTKWFYQPQYLKENKKVSYPMDQENQLYNNYINKIKRDPFLAPYVKYFKLSFSTGVMPNAHQLRSPDRKQDTDYVNFYANGEHLGVAKVHGLDGSNINVSPLGGYMLDPDTHLLFNNGQHRMNLIPLNNPANNLETLNVPVNLDAMPAPSKKPSNDTPSHDATPANSNNTPTNHQNPENNTNNSSRRQGADNENNGSDSQDHNTGNSHTAGVNNNNNERHGNATGGGAGGDSNNNPSNNIAGGNHGNVVNNNDHGNQGNHSNYDNATAEAFAGTVDEHDRNDNQLIDMTDNDMNAALARQQNQEDQNQNYWVNEFKDVDNLAALIQQQHVEDENQAQIRQFNFDQKMAALQKQVTTSFTNPLNQMMNSLN